MCDVSSTCVCSGLCGCAIKFRDDLRCSNRQAVGLVPGVCSAGSWRAPVGRGFRWDLRLGDANFSFFFNWCLVFICSWKTEIYQGAVHNFGYAATRSGSQVRNRGSERAVQHMC